MPEPEVTVRATEAGRVTEVVVPAFAGPQKESVMRNLILNQVPHAVVFYDGLRCYMAIRQPGGPDVVALAGERLRIAAGRVERVQ